MCAYVPFAAVVRGRVSGIFAPLRFEVLLYCICEESSLVLDHLLCGHEMIMWCLDNCVQKTQFSDNATPEFMTSLRRSAAAARIRYPVTHPRQSSPRRADKRSQVMFKPHRASCHRCPLPSRSRVVAASAASAVTSYNPSQARPTHHPDFPHHRSRWGR